MSFKYINRYSEGIENDQNKEQRGISPQNNSKGLNTENSAKNEFKQFSATLDKLLGGARNPNAEREYNELKGTDSVKVIWFEKEDNEIPTPEEAKKLYSMVDKKEYSYKGEDGNYVKYRVNIVDTRTDENNPRRVGFVIVKQELNAGWINFGMGALNALGGIKTADRTMHR